MASSPKENTTSDTNSDQSESSGSPTVDPRSLIAEERTLAFRGLSEIGDSYPEGIEPKLGSARLTDDPSSFKEVIGTLPIASSGELYANNKFVDEFGNVDTAAIRDVKGLDVDALEDATGMGLGNLAAFAPSESLVEVEDHQDIIDERRLALSTLGAPVKFRWQIPSDRYCIVQPSDAFLPIISALQKRNETDAFGWAHYRDWGGEFRMSVLFPSLRRTVVPREIDDDADSITDNDLDGVEIKDGDEDEGVTIYGGVQTGYDFRGSQAVWAKPMLYLPGSDVSVFGVGERRSRKHVGAATDETHERKNNRTPINKWWGKIYDSIESQAKIVDKQIVESRKARINFETVPYSMTEFYSYLGIPDKYAEPAAERAERFAKPSFAPTFWNLQLSLQLALNDLYEASRASSSYQSHNEIGQQIFQRPAYSCRLAYLEHDHQATKDGRETLLPEEQQSLSDSMEDLADIPGVEITSEADLSNVEAQRLQDSATPFQQALDDVGA